MPPIKTKTIDMQAYMRAYYLAHKDRINETRRERMKDTFRRLLRSKQKRAYYLAHRDEEIARMKRYYQQHKLKIQNEKKKSEENH